MTLLYSTNRENLRHFILSTIKKVMTASGKIAWEKDLQESKERDAAKTVAADRKRIDEKIKPKAEEKKENDDEGSKGCCSIA